MIYFAGRRDWVLDLFCKAGGATKGYQKVGYRVLGVDIEPQPNYCGDQFIQADAMDALSWHLGRFKLVHASPPCQRYIRSGMFDREEHPDLLPEVRALLEQAAEIYRMDWVIDNVPGAPLRADYKLCGCMFGLPDLERERWFETSWGGFEIRPPCHHPRPVVGVYGHPRGGAPGQTWGWGTAADWSRAMGIDWMTADEMAEAIPPAYTAHIGWEYRKHLRQMVTLNY